MPIYRSDRRGRHIDAVRQLEVAYRLFYCAWDWHTNCSTRPQLAWAGTFGQGGPARHADIPALFCKTSMKEKTIVHKRQPIAKRHTPAWQDVGPPARPWEDGVARPPRLSPWFAQERHRSAYSTMDPVHQGGASGKTYSQAEISGLPRSSCRRAQVRSVSPMIVFHCMEA